jgi:hypothetical protein
VPSDGACFCSEDPGFLNGDSLESDRRSKRVVCSIRSTIDEGLMDDVMRNSSGTCDVEKLILSVILLSNSVRWIRSDKGLSLKGGVVILSSRGIEDKVGARVDFS